MSQIWKVVHAKDGVETVYLVEADSSRGARRAVLDSLYQRTFPLEKPYTPEQLANDPFKLLAHVNTHGTDRTDAWICKTNGCSVSAQPFTADAPYRLYAFNTKTGEMS